MSGPFHANASANQGRGLPGIGGKSLRPQDNKLGFSALQRIRFLGLGAAQERAQRPCAGMEVLLSLSQSSEIGSICKTGRTGNRQEWQ